MTIATQRVTQKDLALVLGMTAPGVAHLRKTGVLTPGDDGLFTLGPAVQAYQAKKAAEAQAAIEAADQRHRLVRLKAEKMEADAKERARETIPMSESMEMVDHICGYFIASLPEITARVSRHPTERRRVERIIGDVRNRIADHFEEMQKRFAAGESLE